MGVAEKRQTKEGDGGYNCGSTRLSIKNYEYQEDNRHARCVYKVLRMCGEGDETSVSYIVSEYRKLAQKQYRCWRQDKEAQVIHWNLCGKLGFERDENCCSHEPKPV